MTYVLFWDIDGTLLTTGRAGIYAWEEAMKKVLGVSGDLSGFTTGGLTDIKIAENLVEAYGNGAGPDTVMSLVRSYEQHLPGSLTRKQGRVLPGVHELLQYFRDRDGVLSLLLTGNTEAGARIKLTYYGLSEFLTAGAFADDVPDRVAIARKAAKLAHKLAGGPIPPQRMFVIGDTPHDIECGKAIGARTVAVATGSYSASDLERERPWLTLEGLPGPEEFVLALGLDIPAAGGDKHGRS